MSWSSSSVETLCQLVFARRRLIIGIFAILTLGMIAAASQLRINAGFTKLVPMQHPYMQGFMKHSQTFGGADRITVALVQKEKKHDIFEAEFFKTLKAVTDEVFYIKGINRSSVKSLFTPNVRYIEVVAGGFAGDTVIPTSFMPTPEGFEIVRRNIFKSGQFGRLVAHDFQGAMVTAELTELDPDTGERLDYLKVARQLEENIRKKFETEKLGIHIIGFAKLMGEITDKAGNVLGFFLITFLITLGLLWLSTHSRPLTVLPLLCALLAVIWQWGLLTLAGLTMDPMSIVVTFLIFAIAISHAIQMVNAVRLELHAGADKLSAARTGFRRLALPGVAALASDVAGFLTILWIKIEVVREIALSASLGLGSILLINLILLPVLLSYVKIPHSATPTTEHRRPGIRHSLRKVWAVFEHFTHLRKAFITLMLAILLLLGGIWLARDLHIGDVQPGAPELNTQARYNQDVAEIVRHFSIGMDVLTVFAETKADGYADYQVMHLIDQLHNYLEQVPGVHAVISLPGLAKRAYLNWNQGHPKWYVLPRDRDHLILSISPFDARTGLLNFGGSVMPLYIFTQDHKAETITQVVKAVKTFNAVVKPDVVTFRLAGGNVGVMAATNEAVQAAQVPMLVYLYAAIIALCLIFFRSWRAVICIVAPLVLVSVLTYALMAMANIGLKVATLPVVALGAGIGVDYAIYVYSRLREFLQKGDTLLAA